MHSIICLKDIVSSIGIAGCVYTFFTVLHVAWVMVHL